MVPSRPVAAELPRRFYRIVKTDPPTRADFLSHEARGIRPRRPLNPRDRDRWRGVSHFDTPELARATARAAPHLGAFIAELHIPQGAPIRIEQTGRAGHYDIWADPAFLLASVVSVAPVEEVH